MINLLVDTHIWIPVEALDLQAVVNQLSFVNRSIQQKLEFGTPVKKGDELTVDAWEEDEGRGAVGVPRGFPVEEILKPGVKFQLVSGAPAGKHYSGRTVRFRRQLREKQIPVAEALMANKRQDMTLCLGCGKGKTVMAIWYANQMAAKTLVIVDRVFLARQWTKQIKACLWLPSSRVGLVQGKNDTVGDQYTIALAHTLRRPEYDKEWFDQFDLVIFDEAHVMAAPTFRPIITKVECPRLALSATPDRRDGLGPAIFYHFGGLTPVYTDLSRDQSSSWFFKKIPRDLLTEKQLARCYRPLPGKRRRNGERIYMLMRPRYENYVSATDRWREIIEQDVLKAVQAGRNVIVLGGRKEQLSLMAAQLQEYGVKAGTLTSDVDDGDRELVFKNDQVMLATWQLASRALDVERLDTLYLLFPTRDDGFVRQAVGRIDRALEGKGKPLVITYSHQGIESLEKSQTAMIDIIREIDPKASIKYV